MSIFDQSISSPSVLSFNSKDRASGTNSSFVSAPVDLGYNQFDSVALVQASIPRSFYNVPNSYRTFTLRELGVNYIVTMVAGSYNKINLATNLATQLTASSGNGWTYSVTYPSVSQPDTFKYTFSVTGNGANQPSLIFTDSMFRQLGFEEDTTYAFTANSLVSVNCINLAYISRAFIKSNVCINAQNDVLEEILNYGSYPMLSLAYFQQVSYDLNTRNYNPANTNSWLFTLVDSFDQEIDLNGVPWSFSLVFYKRNNIHEIHKNDLLIKNEERLFKIAEEQQKIRDEADGLTTGEVSTSAPSGYLSNETENQPLLEMQTFGLPRTIYNGPI
jgi:hypothetical protein